MTANNLKYRILQWLRKQLDDMRESERQQRLRGVATLSATAQFGPEGTIENIMADPACISVDDHSYVRGRLITYGHGGNIKIGKWCYIGIRTEIWSMQSIEIGDRVLIAHDVNIHDGTAHSQDAIERHAHYHDMMTTGHPRKSLPGVESAPIVIEDDVWISFGVTILKGVRIGKGSIIAANATVTRDVPPGMIYRSQINPVMEPISS